jgi:hypothetical protein
LAPLALGWARVFQFGNTLANVASKRHGSIMQAAKSLKTVGAMGDLGRTTTRQPWLQKIGMQERTTQRYMAAAKSDKIIGSIGDLDRNHDAAKPKTLKSRWLPWLKKIGMPERTARQYMAEAKSAKIIGSIADLDQNRTQWMCRSPRRSDIWPRRRNYSKPPDR